LEALGNAGSAALCELIEFLSYVEHLIKMRFRTGCGLDLRRRFIGAPRSRGNQKYAKQDNRFQPGGEVFPRQLGNRSRS
jgi:hypothetical protein